MRIIIEANIKYDFFQIDTLVSKYICYYSNMLARMMFTEIPFPSRKAKAQTVQSAPTCTSYLPFLCSEKIVIHRYSGFKRFFLTLQLQD